MMRRRCGIPASFSHDLKRESGPGSWGQNGSAVGHDLLEKGKLTYCTVVNVEHYKASKCGDREAAVLQLCNILNGVEDGIPDFD